MESAGGGRIIGEACHFIDLLRFLAGCSDHRQRRAPYRRRGRGVRRSFRLHHLEFCRRVARNHSLSDRRPRFLSQGTSRGICGRARTAIGQFSPPARLWWPGFGSQRLWRQDKGQNACAAAFVSDRVGERVADPARGDPRSQPSDDRSERSGTALSSLANYFHTLRYLRPVQVFGRVRFTACAAATRRRAAPPLRARCHAYAAPIRPAPSMLGPDRFRLLNLEGTCSAAAALAGARPRATVGLQSPLFRRSQRRGRGRAPRHGMKRLIERWIEENPPGRGIGWDPYPVSRRMVNWIKWSLGRERPDAEGAPSLAVQARWLNGASSRTCRAIMCSPTPRRWIHAGLFFEGEEAERGCAAACPLMRRELVEQVLADGGHFERSPMYHAGIRRGSARHRRTSCKPTGARPIPPGAGRSCA